MSRTIPQVGDVITLTMTEDDATSSRKKGWTLGTIVLTVSGENTAFCLVEVLGGALLQGRIISFYLVDGSDHWIAGGIGSRPPFTLQVTDHLNRLPTSEIVRSIEAEQRIPSEGD